MQATSTRPSAIALLLLAASLLPACSSLPRMPGWAMQPVLRATDTPGLDAANYYLLGRYHQQRGETAAATSAFNRSIALAPHQLDARNALAVLLAEQGQLEPAADMLRQLAAEFPMLAQPRSNLAYVYHLQGHEQAAQQQLRQTLAVTPGHPQARANLELVQAALAGVGTPLSISSPAPALAQAPRAGTPSTATPAPRAPASRMTLTQETQQEWRMQAATAEALQIVNGNGKPGMGERVRNLLQVRGYGYAQVVPQRGYHQHHTIIEYLPGRQQQAADLQSALQTRTLLLPARTLPDGIGVRLVLGHDLLRRHTRHGAPMPLLALNDTPAFNQE